MNVCRFVLIGAFLFIASLPSFAADVTAKIRGTVTDPQGAVLPNTTVSATNQATGVVANTVTKGDGSYEFLSLPIGVYTISVQAPGFQSFKATGIKLDISSEYTEPVKLAVGSASDTVNVSADAVQVDTTNIQLNNVVGAAQIVELPLIGRNFTQLEQLLPGVQSPSDRFGAASVNGNQTQQSAYLINGTDTNDLPLNSITFVPSVDAISEFNLVTSSLNAEYSRNSGAIVSATIKNGTNHFHGDVFEFYRDTFLNTANFFQKKPTTGPLAIPGGGVPVFHQNLFGGTLGGPIWRDKLFFFGSYQGTRARQPESNTVTSDVYTAAQRGGDFSAQAGTFSSNIVPLGVSIPGCTSGTDTFAACFAKIGNVIPAAAINPISAALLKFVPLPNAGGSSFTFNPSTKLIQDQYIGRVDFSPTTRDQMWFLYIQQHNPTVNDLPFTGATVPGFGDQSTREIHQYAFDYTHQFGATAVNDLSLHYNRFNFGAGVPQKAVNPASLGFAIFPVNPSLSSVPTIAIGNGNTLVLGGTTNGPQPRLDQTYQAADSFSKIIGRHSLKVGYEGRRFNVTNPFLARLSGSFGFSDLNNRDGSGSGLADFLLGIPDSYAQGTGGVIVAYAFENYMYAQDQWKASKDLTVTLGAGYQIDTPLHNRQYKGIGVTCFQPGAQSKIFPSAPAGLIYPGDTGCNDASGAVTHYNEIGPRVGFAYTPNLGFLSGGDSQKLSIRAGYGIYYNRSEEETALQNLGDPPFGLNTAGSGDVGGKPGFANPFQDLVTNTTIPNKFPFVQPGVGAQIDFTQFGPLQLSQFGPSFRAPYSQNFNLTIQREFRGGIVATASYVGALGRHEQTVIEGNPVTPAGQQACLNDPLNGSGNGCVDNRDFQGQLYPSHTQFGVANPALGTPIPTEAGINQFEANGLISSTGNSNYNALELSAKKDLSRGLLFQASYTYSHSLDDASSFENSGFGNSGRGYNQFVSGLNYGNSSFDARHRFVISPVYDLPGLGGSGGFRSFAKVLTNGWEIAGISTFATGFPFDIAYNGGVSNSLFCSAGSGFYACPDVPNQTGPLVRTNPKTLQKTARFNHPAGSTSNNGHFFFSGGTNFTAEAIGAFGNESRNKYHGPGFDNTDVLVSKNFKIPGNESTSLQLRLESYNVFNHTNFGLPSGNTSGSLSFGQITTAAAGRQTQLGAKFYF